MQVVGEWFICLVNGIFVKKNSYEQGNKFSGSEDPA